MVMWQYVIRTLRFRVQQSHSHVIAENAKSESHRRLCLWLSFGISVSLFVLELLFQLLLPFVYSVKGNEKETKALKG